MQKVEEWFCNEFAEDVFRFSVRVETGDSMEKFMRYFVVKETVVEVCKEGWGWPIIGKTFTVKKPIFAIATFDGDVPRPKRISEIEVGSDLFFQLCRDKRGIVEGIHKELGFRRENDLARHRHIQQCMDSFREMVDDEGI